MSMDPDIRYATTSDGAKIAWYSVGDGIPWLWPHRPPSHVEMQLRMPELRQNIEIWPSRGARLIGCDLRGSGLSDRGPVDRSIDAMVRDLEAVLDAAGVQHPVVLQGYWYTTMPLISFAARYPERVRGLVCQNGVLRGADLPESWRRLVQLARDDWEDAKTTFARMHDAGWVQTVRSFEQVRRMLDSAATQEEFLWFAEALEGWDVAAEARAVAAPTLVLHYGWPNFLEATRRVAAAVPNATFATIDGSGSGEGLTEALPVYERFIQRMFPRAPRQARPVSPVTAQSGTAVILFTDIVDSTPLTERLGDARFRELSRSLDAGLRSAIREAGGSAIEGKLLGDGVLATFSSAAQAIDGARRCLALSAASELGLHIGLHAGDVIREDGNVFGGAVNIAARICGLSAPGEILVSDVVRGMARSSAGVVFEDRGEQEMKGVGEPVRVYAVRASA